MKTLKFIVLILIFVLCAGTIVGCSPGAPAANLKIDPDFDQFASAQPGEEIAVISVKDYGDITIRLFPQYAPNAVENFKYLANESYYDGSPFHRVMKDFMVQSGRPAGEDAVEKTKWGEDASFEVERNDNLHHYTGALSVARKSSSAFMEDGSNPDEARIRSLKEGQGSEFFIVQASKDNIESYSRQGIFANYESSIEGNYAINYAFSQEVKDKYKEVGGAAALDMGYTVFGQVMTGMDIVDKIANVETKLNDVGDERSVPKKDIIIESVKITPMS